MRDVAETILNETVEAPVKRKGPSLEQTAEAFHNLLIDEVFVHPKIKQTMENALQGKSLLSAQQLHELIRIDISEVLGNDQNLYQEKLKEKGFILTDKQIEDLIITAWSCDELIPISLRKKYGWGLPSEEAILTILDQLQKSTGLIEIGAGSGLWSGIIQSRTEKEVIACELNLRGDTPRPKFYNVENIDANKLIAQHPDHAILIVWVDINDVGLEIAKKMNTGNKVILVGPIHVTGSTQFYKYIDDNFDIITQNDATSFSGGIDHIYVLEKRENPKEYVDTYFADQRIKDKIARKLKASQNNMKI